MRKSEGRQSCIKSEYIHEYLHIILRKPGKEGEEKGKKAKIPVEYSMLFLYTVIDITDEVNNI